MALLALNYAIGFADPAPSCECDHCGRGVSDEMQFLQFVFAAVGFYGRIFPGADGFVGDYFCNDYERNHLGGSVRSIIYKL